MSLETVWIPNPDVRKRVIAEETLLLTVKGNRVVVLNEQASIVWSKLAKSKICRESEIVKKLQSEYPDVSVKQLQTDVHNLFTILQSKGFVHQDKKSSQPLIPLNEGTSVGLGHLTFSEQLHQLATLHNVPISGGLEITQRCHLRCQHCYLDGQPVSYREELTTGKLCNLLEQIAEAGCLWFLITGGEPLLRSDFCEIYHHAKELGMIVTVFTSAINLTKRVADVFAEYPPFLVEATLHGATAETFDAISGISGSFQRFQKGIQLLKERQIPFHLKMIVMRSNLHEVEGASYLAFNLGAGDFRFDPMVNSDFLHSPKALELRITVEEAIKLDLLEPYRSRWEKIYRTALAKQATQKPAVGFLFPCRAGRCSFTISADGQLLPCVLMRIPSYNLHRMSFASAWKELNRHTTMVRMRENNQCLTCSVQTCSKCPAWGYLEHGDPDVKSEFACALQREREQVFFSLTNKRKEVRS